MLEHVAAGGVSAVFILGTTGEGPSLSRKAAEEVIEFTCGRSTLPVLVGLCNPSIPENLEIARYAQKAGAAGLVVTPPYYYRLSQPELQSWLEKFIPRLKLPTFLYNIPGLTKIAISPEVLTNIASIPNLVGLKDSSGDLEYFAAVRKALPADTGFRLFCGPEEMLAKAVYAGADGGVCGGSNMFPKLYVELFEAARNGDRERASSLQETVQFVSRNVYHQLDGESSYLRGLKCALSALGRCRPILAEPLAPPDGKGAQAICDFVSSVPDLLLNGRHLPLAAGMPMR
jgi:4-hydroxy-tetrahydrodipicolinate synthase